MKKFKVKQKKIFRGVTANRHRQTDNLYIFILRWEFRKERFKKIRKKTRFRLRKRKIIEKKRENTL